MVKEIKECREKAQNPRDIQKVQSVEDWIKTVIWKSENVARLAREDLLGPVRSPMREM